MARPKTLFLALLFLNSCVFYKNHHDPSVFDAALQDRSAAIITAGDLKDYVAFLTDSNFTAGRGTGQIGYEVARDFLAERLREMGYEVVIQRFPVYEGFSPGQVTNDPVYSWNVIGLLRGESSASGAVMFSAHADHTGIFAGSVYPGADDNASGVAVVLNIARAFSLMRSSGAVFERSVVICFFGAEERWNMPGSSYFLGSEFFDSLGSVALLNFDMVGRGGRDSLVILGSARNNRFLEESPTLYGLINELNSESLVVINLAPIFPESLISRYGSSFRRSDHWNFYRIRIPVLFFFTGLHEDYHRITDTAEKLDYEKNGSHRSSRIPYRFTACGNRHVGSFQTRILVCGPALIGGSFY